MSDSKLTRGSQAAADVASLLRARNPLLWIVSREEARVERLLLESGQAAKYEPVFWDCATGLSRFDGSPVGQGTSLTDPAQVLAAIRDSKARQVWVLRDLPAFLKDPFVLRALRSLARSLPLAPRDEARAVVVLTPSSEVPPELQGHAVVIDWPLPDRDEVAAILDSAVASLPEDLRATAASNGVREAAIDAAVGLTEEEARSCYSRSLVTSRTIDPATVAGEKRRVIAREKVLEWFDPLPGGLEAVGGLELLKAWLLQRRAAFSSKARAYGLPAPRGVLLVGQSGCGKSLTAKAIATAWGWPLLRCDVGALMSKYVGESGSNVRKSFKVAEAVAPCVFWLDEVDKAFEGASGGDADGGAARDVFGAFLSWMQERQGAVFIIATANDVSKLPPEFLRKGRFDELFYIDLPTAAERAAILDASLRAVGRSLPLADLASLALVTSDFNGAELAALVPEALFAAFADGERAVRLEDLATAAAAVVPLARTAAEKVEALRRWAKGRARFASAPEVVKGGGRALDL